MSLRPPRHPLASAVLAVLIGVGASSSARAQSDPLEDGRWSEANAGLVSLNTRLIAADPSSPDRLYTATRGLLYRTADRGSRWEVVYSLRVGRDEGELDRSGDETVDTERVESLTADQLQEVEALFLDLQEERLEELLEELDDEADALAELEAASDELLLLAFESVAGGRAAGEADREERIEESQRGFLQLAVDATEPGRVYAATGSGLLRSADFGHSWDRTYRGAGGERRRVTAVLPLGDTVLIGTGLGLQRSSDGGLTFSAVGDALGAVPIDWIASAPGWPDTIYTLADGRVFRSDDRGASFAPLAVPMGSSASGLNAIALDPDDPDRAYLATDDGVMLSENGGASFMPAGHVGLRDRRVADVRVTHGRVVAATPAGIFVADLAAQTWRSHTDGLSTPSIRQLAVGPSTSTGTVRLWAATEAGPFQLLERVAFTASAAAARRARDRWAREPSMSQTIDAALSCYDLDNLPIDSWARRAWWSRFVPTLRTRLDWDFVRDETEDFFPGSSGAPLTSAFDVRRQEDFEWAVWVEWDLYSLLTSGSILPARRSDTSAVGTVVITDPADTAVAEGRDLVELRQELILLVTRVYDSRRETILRVAGQGPTSINRIVMDELQLQELTARLDFMTCNFFSGISAAMGVEPPPE